MADISYSTCLKEINLQHMKTGLFWPFGFVQRAIVMQPCELSWPTKAREKHTKTKQNEWSIDEGIRDRWYSYMIVWQKNK